MINLIVATDKYFGFSKEGTIPWYYQEDLQHFKNETLNQCVVMGKNTYNDIGHPLKNRVNIIISKTLEDSDKYTRYDNLNVGLLFTALKYPDKKIFLCGGYNIYEEALLNNQVDNIILTYIKKDYKCDKFINVNHLYGFKIQKVINYDEFDIYYLNKNKSEITISYKFKLPIFISEFSYLNVLNLILNKGKLTESRNGTTLDIFSPPEMVFNLQNGFPLLTTKKMFWKGIVMELIMFINGITDSNYLSSNGIKIWDLNTNREFLDKSGLESYSVGDMGPMYGWNWRHFGAKYEGKDADYTNKGFDQLDNLINMIKTEPNSRRLLLTSLDPSKIKESVLPPCHSLPIQFSIEDEYIDCKMTQRSADMFLGVPFNIASTSLLLCLIGKLTGYKPRYVVISIGKGHIYYDHIEKCKLQISRCPYDLCDLNITKKLENLKDLETLKYEDVELINYVSHPAINAKMIA